MIPHARSIVHSEHRQVKEEHSSTESSDAAPSGTGRNIVLAAEAQTLAARKDTGKGS